MRSVSELIDNDDPAWPVVMEWIASAKNSVVILPADPVRAEDALYKIQVTTRSPMGSIVYKTGGLLVDDGWIRILGSGSIQLPRTLPDWNNNTILHNDDQPPGLLLIADDAIGGFFILNGGRLGDDRGHVYYLSPATLEFEPLSITYSEFLNFCFQADLAEFYEGLRWENWREEVKHLAGDRVFSFYPFLWTAEGRNMAALSRTTIPIEEHFRLMWGMNDPQ
ncbi:DUF2625 domain-containing protein [Chryseolinea lacunae]|uniref:DUF2625 domain-containing protein n=1 Tax=Chryseolinea lacunae TaxID=2801331 RepID=A0ABS1L2W8_9BACT|nr:DUF2625 domain-containing protein [Chryseolinea lacunae]MBL0745910.1 DUF2625 domain-containing protein [Chryseolinea lacunae]